MKLWEREGVKKKGKGKRGGDPQYCSGKPENKIKRFQERKTIEWKKGFGEIGGERFSITGDNQGDTSIFGLGDDAGSLHMRKRGAAGKGEGTFFCGLVQS